MSSPLPNRRRNTAPPGTILHERRVASQLKPVAPIMPWIQAAVAILLIAVVTVTAVALWSARTEEVAPRNRAEAVCFSLTQRPVFMPTVSVSCETEVLESRYGGAEVTQVLPSALAPGEELLVAPGRRRVGDFQVATLWARRPEPGGASHWLVVGWIEGSDLAVCRFRVGGSGETLSEDDRRWGEVIADRLLVAENFQASGFPELRVRLPRGERLPRFGPAPATRS